MRAAVFEAVGKPLAIENVADPTPGDGQLVLRTLLADGEFAGKRFAPYDPPIFNTIRILLKRWGPLPDR